jgi:hypothetical protein
MSPSELDVLTLAYSLGAAGEVDRALAVLDLAMSSEDRALDALELKGELLRSRGELRDAAEVFALLAEREPDHPRARYVSELLRGSSPRVPAVCSAPWPSAFVRHEQFLNGVRHAELLDLVTTHAVAFEPSTVGAIGPDGRGPRVDLDTRVSFRLREVSSIAYWMRPLISEQLPSVRLQLGLAPFTAGEIELKCTAYGDGSFFSTHSDNVLHPTRRISFVYYFHRVPKRYSGGALLLYDGDRADATRYFPDRVTRLETLDNSVVFFPSSAYHEVTPVVSPSGRFEDSRFTFAGHVHAVDGDASARGSMS